MWAAGQREHVIYSPELTVFFFGTLTEFAKNNSELVNWLKL